MEVSSFDLFYSLWTLGLLLFIAVQLVKRAGVISKAVKAKDVGCIKINSLLLGVCLLGLPCQLRHF